MMKKRWKYDTPVLMRERGKDYTYPTIDNYWVCGNFIDEYFHIPWKECNHIIMRIANYPTANAVKIALYVPRYMWHDLMDRQLWVGYNADEASELIWPSLEWFIQDKCSYENSLDNLSYGTMYTNMLSWLRDIPMAQAYVKRLAKSLVREDEKPPRKMWGYVSVYTVESEE